MTRDRDRRDDDYSDNAGFREDFTGPDDFRGRGTQGEVSMDQYMRGDYRRGDTDSQGQGFIDRSARRHVNDAAPRQYDGQWQYRGEEHYVQDQSRRQLGVQDSGGRFAQRQPSHTERYEPGRWAEDSAYRRAAGPSTFSAQTFGAEAAAGASFQGNGTSFRGKGPKGHQRSDERIREDVSDALEDAHNVDASDIDVTVQGGEVTLSGTVADRAQKRAAADCIEHLRGVRDVHNHLRLQSSPLNR